MGLSGGEVVSISLFLTRVHQFPELVHKSFGAERRLRCSGEGRILRQHAENLMSAKEEKKLKLKYQYYNIHSILV